jgi:hypothetical protein
MDAPRKLGLTVTAQSADQGARRDPAVQYRVTGLASDQQAWIGLSANHRWAYLRERSGIQAGVWHGDYKTAEDALSGLAEEIGRDR